jgi:cytochrome c biogenesis factor
MIPEIGHYPIALALMLSAAQGIVRLIGAQLNYAKMLERSTGGDRDCEAALRCQTTAACQGNA